MQDISEKLLEKIQRDFAEKVNKDVFIKAYLRKLRGGTATQEDTSLYARMLGEKLSETLQQDLTQEVLPNGTLYYNIAEKTVKPMMVQNFNDVQDKAAEVQKTLDKMQKIGLKPVKANIPEDRLNGILNGLDGTKREWDEVYKAMGEPVANCTQSFFDDFVRANAEFRSRAGYTSIIARVAEAGACKWCKNLAGRYEYPVKDEMVYHRHDNCRCIVEFFTDKYHQNAHTKKVIYYSDEGRNARIESNNNYKASIVKDWESFNKNRTISRKFTNAHFYTGDKPTAFDNTKPAPFARQVELAKQTCPEKDRWRVDVHSPDDYVKDKLHITVGNSAVAVTPDGDIISVCHNSNDLEARGHDLLKLAIENGGTKLDSFAGNHRFYCRQGFEPVSWVPFNKEYAPDGWREGIDSEEPVIFYRYTGKPTIVDNAKEFLNKVSPSSSYDAARKLRDEVIKNDL